MNSSSIQHISEKQFADNKFGIWSNRFIISASIILILTGFAKLFSAYGHAKIILAPNAIIPHFQNRHIFILAGLLEIGIGLLCFSTERAKLSKLVTLNVLTLCFLVYRFGLWWVGFNGACPCMGNAAAWLHLSPEVANNIMKSVLLYLQVFGILFLANEVHWQRVNASQKTGKP